MDDILEDGEETSAVEQESTLCVPRDKPSCGGNTAMVYAVEDDIAHFDNGACCGKTASPFLKRLRFYVRKEREKKWD